MPPRSRRRSLLSVAVAAVALVSVVPGTVSAASGDPIVPDELSEGPPPAYSYVDAGTLVTRGFGTLDLPDGSSSSQVYKAGTGWLTKVTAGREQSLVLTQPDGAERTVVPPGPPIGEMRVSSDGRLVVMRTAPRRLAVYRISDGSRVARLHLEQDVYPIAMRPERVLVAREPTPAHATEYSLAWWDVAGRDKGALKTFFRARRWDNLSSPVPAVDLSAGQFVERRRFRNVVRSLERTGTTWEVPRTEYVGTWSPDDHLVVSVPRPVHNNRAAEILRVRNHRTGAVVARFNGLFDYPVWETNDTLLLGAYSGLIAGNEGGYEPDPAGRETIRCRVSTETCEKVLPSDHVVYFVTRMSN